MSNKKYFSYVRVSTQRQGQHGTSLVEQQASIERFARTWDLSIVERFEERETAAKQGRPIFLEMLKQLRAGRASGVIIHKIDRSARNLKDWADLGALIDSGLEVHFAAESLDLNSRGGRLSADIQAVVASDYIRNLREETKKGMYGRLKQGLFPFRAPIGYLDRGKGKPKDIDPAIGPLVRKAFEMYGSGDWALHALAKSLTDLGLRNRAGGKLTINGLSTLLHNPFYMGVIRIDKSGETFTGIHKPLIPRILFDKVQEVLAGKNIQKHFAHSFTFRKLIRCGKCSNRLIAERQKRLYVYYRCHTKGCMMGCLKEETIVTAVTAKFKRIQLRGDEYDLLKTLAAEFDERWNEYSEARHAEIILRKKHVKSRHSKLVDTYMDGIFDRETYLLKKAELTFEEEDLTNRLSSLRKSSDDRVSELEEFLELAHSAYLSFKFAPPDLKRELVKTVTSNLTATGKSVVVTLEKPFEVLAEREALTVGSPCRDTARTLLAKICEVLKIFGEVNLVEPNSDVGLTP